MANKEIILDVEYARHLKYLLEERKRKDKEWKCDCCMEILDEINKQLDLLLSGDEQ